MLRHAWQTKNPSPCLVAVLVLRRGRRLCQLDLARRQALVLVNGYFGLRHCDMASRYGAEIIKLESPWGEVFTPEEVDAACAEHKPDMIWVATRRRRRGLPAHGPARRDRAQPRLPAAADTVNVLVALRRAFVA